MAGTLALAVSIAAMDRASLRRMLRLRAPSNPGSVRDPIGLAIELLRPESVSRALETLSREQLAALVNSDDRPVGSPPETVDGLRQLGLIGLEGTDPKLLPEVSAAVREGLERVGIDPEAFTASPSAERPAETGDAKPTAASAAWYGPALTSVQQAAAVLRTLRRHPGRIGRRGAISAVTLRALADAAKTSPDGAQRLIGAMELAGLTANLPPASPADHGRTVPSSSAARWLALPHTDRWLELARGARSAMSPQLLDALRRSAGDLRHASAAGLGDRYPLLPHRDRKAAEEFALSAEELGLTWEGVLTSTGWCLVDGDLKAARASAEGVMPEVVPGVYVQPDLSVVIPGPLHPADERSLFAVCDVEQLGIASTLRVTEASLIRGLEAGTDLDAVRGLFDRLSLTGVPQPLDYLLTDLSERLGSIVVHEYHGDEGRSRIVVARPELLDALLLDRSLQHVQFQPAAGRNAAYSRLSAEHVLSALSEARYPATSASPSPAVPSQAAAEGPEPTSGTTGATAETRGAGVPATPPPAEKSRPSDLSPSDLSADPSAELDELADRVHEAALTGAGGGDVARKLELAIRDRMTVRVTAEARGQRQEFTLLPASLTGGRLRASDPVAGVERTLPVSAITAVDPA